MGFYQMNLIVVLCGVLMIYNIVRISAGQNIRFYGRVCVRKSRNGTKRQLGMESNCKCRRYKVLEENVKYLPLYMGIDGEESQGLCIGTAF